ERPATSERIKCDEANVADFLPGRQPGLWAHHISDMAIAAERPILRRQETDFDRGRQTEFWHDGLEFHLHLPTDVIHLRFNVHVECRTVVTHRLGVLVMLRAHRDGKEMIAETDADQF